MRLDPVVHTAVRSYLEAVDAAVPGLVQRAYLTGSATMNDFRPGASDVDLVAVCAAPPNEAHIQALAVLHRASEPQVDVLYITPDDLRSDPARLSPAYSLQGTLYRDGAFAANPVTWRELETHSFAVRGPSLEAGDVWFDADVLRSWNVDNLDHYWRRQVDVWRQVYPTDDLIRHEYGLQWVVLGVPRLHYTIATLSVCSKTAAGHYALRVVDRRWHPVIHAAIALRADRTTALQVRPEEMRRQAVDLATWIIDDAHRLRPE